MGGRRVHYNTVPSIKNIIEMIQPKKKKVEKNTNYDQPAPCITIFGFHFIVHLSSILAMLRTMCCWPGFLAN